MANTLNWDKNGNIYYTDSDGNLIQNQILFQERLLNEIQKAKTIAQQLTPQERSDILMGGIAMLAPIKGLNYIGRVNAYNKIKQIYDLRKDWGIAYRSLSGKPEKAIEFLLKNKRGFVPNAMYKRGIGNIDFVWGDSAKGLQHIIQRRNNEGINGVEFIKQLPNNIRAGRTFKKNGHIDRNYILNNQTETSIKSKWNDKNRNWIVSAYNRKDSNKALPGFRTYEQNYFDKQQIPLSNFIESNYIIPYSSLNFNVINKTFKQNKSASKRLMNDAPLSNIIFGNGTHSIPKLVAPSYIIPQNEQNFNSRNAFIKKLVVVGCVYTHHSMIQ